VKGLLRYRDAGRELDFGGRVDTQWEFPTHHDSFQLKLPSRCAPTPASCLAATNTIPGSQSLQFFNFIFSSHLFYLIISFFISFRREHPPTLIFLQILSNLFGALGAFSVLTAGSALGSSSIQYLN
jgi:hypothetical protein